MAQSTRLAREWVEVREEGDDSRIVLRPLDYPIPPSRGGRRRLDLVQTGAARHMGVGAADAMEQKASGTWSADGDVLRIDMQGWRGEYRIEELSDEILVLRRQ